MRWKDKRLGEGVRQRAERRAEYAVHSVTCVYGESDGEEDDDGGGQRRMVFLGQLRRPSLLLLAFRETGEERNVPRHS